MPPPASRPAAANMAAGVARESAQGQVTTSTDTATMSARSGSRSHHHSAAPAALSSTASKKGLASRSAMRASVGLVAEAASISATMCAKRVSAATRCTRTHSVALRLKLPASTDAPTPRRKGSDSPVSSASSTLLVPCSTTPSAANDSPGCTRSKSPTPRRRTATRSKVPSGVWRSAASGRRFITASSAPAVRSRRRSSSQRPLSKKKTNMVSESKYTSRPKVPLGSNVPAVLTANVTAIPKATGRSMPMRRCSTSCQALRKKGPQEKKTTGSVSTQDAQRSKDSISPLRSPGLAV